MDEDTLLTQEDFNDDISNAIIDAGGEQSDDGSLFFTFDDSETQTDDIPTNTQPSERFSGVDPITGEELAVEDISQPIEPIERGITTEDFLENPEFAVEILRRAGLQIGRDVGGLFGDARDFLSDNVGNFSNQSRLERILRNPRRAPGGTAGLFGRDITEQALQGGIVEGSNEIVERINPDIDTTPF